MKDGYLTTDQLNRMWELLRIADKCRTDVADDFIEMIFDKLDCNLCPMHGKCETEKAQEENEDLLGDVKSCWATLYDWTIEGEP